MKIKPTINIYITESTIINAGRGVFASQNLKKGEVIEICPILDVPEKDYPLMKKTILRNYYFMWNKTNTKAVIAMGYGMLYNHSYNPNATYEKDKKRGVVIFKTVTDIKKNEEITINYNYGDLESKEKLWIKEIPEAD